MYSLLPSRRPFAFLALLLLVLFISPPLVHAEDQQNEEEEEEWDYEEYYESQHENYEGKNLYFQYDADGYQASCSTYNYYGLVLEDIEITCEEVMIQKHPYYSYYNDDVYEQEVNCTNVDDDNNPDCQQDDDAVRNFYNMKWEYYQNHKDQVDQYYRQGQGEDQVGDDDDDGGNDDDNDDDVADEEDMNEEEFDEEDYWQQQQYQQAAQYASQTYQYPSYSQMASNPDKYQYGYYFNGNTQPPYYYNNYNQDQWDGYENYQNQQDNEADNFIQACDLNQPFTVKAKFSTKYNYPGFVDISTKLCKANGNNCLEIANKKSVNLRCLEEDDYDECQQDNNDEDSSPIAEAGEFEIEQEFDWLTFNYTGKKLEYAHVQAQYDENNPNYYDTNTKQSWRQYRKYNQHGQEVDDDDEDEDYYYAYTRRYYRTVDYTDVEDFLESAVRSLTFRFSIKPAYESQGWFQRSVNCHLPLKLIDPEYKEEQLETNYGNNKHYYNDEYYESEYYEQLQEASLAAVVVLLVLVGLIGIRHRRRASSRQIMTVEMSIMEEAAAARSTGQESLPDDDDEISRYRAAQDHDHQDATTDFIPL